MHVAIKQETKIIFCVGAKSYVSELIKITTRLDPLISKRVFSNEFVLRNTEDRTPAAGTPVIENRVIGFRGVVLMGVGNDSK